jgi:putative pyruvate formate lyase activating enzyme
MGEEPCLSGTAGSGAVFFSGCPLRCCYCQNRPVSAGNFGRDISVSRLADIFLELQRQGAHNINLGSPTPYVPWIVRAREAAGPALSVPIVYNTSGYENVETLRTLDGWVDVYLPDLKYRDDALAARYSEAAGYFEIASEAIVEMYRQTGPAVFDERGLMRRGLLIRHLVLPGAYRDSIAILEWIAANLPAEAIRVSLMTSIRPCIPTQHIPSLTGG